MIRKLTTTLAMVIAVGGMTTVAVADPDVSSAPGPHRHWVQNPSGGFSQVGPRICDNPDLADAFYQFHANLHRSTAVSQGPVAPGMHDGQGGEIVATGCLSQP